MAKQRKRAPDRGRWERKKSEQARARIITLSFKPSLFSLDFSLCVCRALALALLIFSFSRLRRREIDRTALEKTDSELAPSSLIRKERKKKEKLGDHAGATPLLSSSNTPMPPRVLLLPVDDSDDSERAVQFVLNQIHRPGSEDEIHLCVVVAGSHPVLAPGTDGVPVALEDDDATKEAATKAAAEFLSRRFEPLMKAAGAKHTFEVVRFLTDAASVGDAVARRASELGATLVAIAGHGKGKLAKWLLGSVTEEVVARCSVPVLLVQ